MKVALIHDYLREYGGAERVLEAIHEIWPQAPLYTSFVDWETLGIHAARFRGWDIRPSWVQHNWLVRKFHSPLRFLAPKIWESFSAKGGSASGGDLSGYDVVISSSGWFICRGAYRGSLFDSHRQGPDLLPFHQTISAKAVTVLEKTRRAAPSELSGVCRGGHSPNVHICYIHHPPRNLYGYPTGSTLQKYWPVRVYATIVNFFLRHYDYETAQKVDYFVANSQETARRVRKFYRRESTVIYPPVDIKVICDKQYVISKTKNLSPIASRLSHNGYFLSVGRLMWAKRVDLAIMAANKLKLPLKVVGAGPEEKNLRALAGPTVEFLGSVSDSELAELYAGARATVFAALDEDFGIVPVESMAAGTPVIALAQGGVVESVIDPSAGSGQAATGVLFNEPTVEALTAAIKTFSKMKRDWFAECQEQAKKFSKERFKKQFKAFVEDKARKSSSH